MFYRCLIFADAAAAIFRYFVAFRLRLLPRCCYDAADSGHYAQRALLMLRFAIR